jgi:ATP synthase protein I
LHVERGTSAAGRAQTETEKAAGSAAVSEQRVEERNPHAENVRKLANAMLRHVLIAGGLTLVLAVVVAALWEGVPGLISALAGGSMALGSALGTLYIMRLVADLPPTFVRAVVLSSYIVKILALFVAMAALRFVETVHPLSLAFAMLAVVVVIAAAEVCAFHRTKIPTLVISAGT